MFVCVCVRVQKCRENTLLIIRLFFSYSQNFQKKKHLHTRLITLWPLDMSPLNWFPLFLDVRKFYAKFSGMHSKATSTVKEDNTMVSGHTLGRHVYYLTFIFFLILLVTKCLCVWDVHLRPQNKKVKMRNHKQNRTFSHLNSLKHIWKKRK